jgi:O-antigen/teichoic acid export membrane protein
MLFGITATWIYTIPLIALMKVIFDFNVNIIRNESKVVLFGVFQVSSTVIEMGLSLAFVVLFGLSWIGRAGGILFAAIITGFASLVFMTKRGYFLWSPDLAMIRSSLKVSIPLIFHTLSTVIINMSDRFFIERMQGQEALGIYNVGYTFGMMGLLVVDAISKVWTPWLFKQLANENKKQKEFIVQLTYVGFVGLILMAIVLTGISWIAIPIMTDKAYHGAVTYVSWVALSYAIRGMYSLVFPYLVHKDKTQFVGVSTVTAAILNLIANYFLIKHFGAVGAAQATLLSFTVLFIGVWWYAQRIYPMPWGLKFLRQRKASS